MLHESLRIGAACGGLFLSGCSGAPAAGGDVGAGGGSTVSVGGGSSTGGSDGAGAAPAAGGTTAVGGGSGTGGQLSGSGGAPGGGGFDCDARTDLLLCEDFEGADVGSIPAGWTAEGDVAVVEGGAAGTRSLRMGAANSGPRRISRPTPSLGAHWGRVRYRVQTPTPAVFVHSTLVELTGDGPELGTAWYRVVDTVQDAERKHQFLFNVQPASSGEFGKGSPYDWEFTDEWQCAEWQVDGANQKYRFFLNDTEVTSVAIENGAGNYGTGQDRTHLPAIFTNLALGWYNYQSAAPGFVAWLDDLAIGNDQVGCD